MRKLVLLGAVLAVGVSLAAQRNTQPAAPKRPEAAKAGAPRAADGHADLNGIWQALNEANYDIEAHNARPALIVRPGPYGPVPATPVLALGAIGAVPPGLGIVEGGELPYQPAAREQRKKNQENW